MKTTLDHKHLHYSFSFFKSGVIYLYRKFSQSNTVQNCHARISTSSSISHFFRSCGYPCALEVEGDTTQSSFVSRNVHRRPLCVGQVYYLHMSRVGAGKCQQRVVAVWTQNTQTCKDNRRSKLHQLSENIPEENNSVTTNNAILLQVNVIKLHKHTK